MCIYIYIIDVPSLYPHYIHYITIISPFYAVSIISPLRICIPPQIYLPISTILAAVTVGYRQHPSLGHEGNDLVGRWGRPQATRSRAGHGRANGGHGGHGGQVRFEHVKLMWFFKWFSITIWGFIFICFSNETKTIWGFIEGKNKGIKVWELGGICGLVFTTLDLRWLYRSAQNSTGKCGDQESFDEPTPVSLAQASWPVFLYVPCFFVLLFYSEYCWSHIVTYGHILNVGRSPTSRQTISSICCWKLIPLLELYPHRRVMVSSCSAGIPGCNSSVIGNSRMADGQLFPSRRLHLPSLGWCCCGSTDDNCVWLLRANPPILVAGSISGLPHFGMIPNDEHSNFYPKAGPLQSPSFGGTNGATGQLACHGVSWYMFFSLFNPIGWQQF